MALVHYTATVKNDRLLELPEEAKKLHLVPGQEIEIQFEGTDDEPNDTLAAFDDFIQSQKGRPDSDGSDTLRLIREARAGAMYGHDPS